MVLGGQKLCKKGFSCNKRIVAITRLHLIKNVMLSKQLSKHLNHTIPQETRSSIIPLNRLVKVSLGLTAKQSIFSDCDNFGASSKSTVIIGRKKMAKHKACSLIVSSKSAKKSFLGYNSSTFKLHFLRACVSSVQQWSMSWSWCFCLNCWSVAETMKQTRSVAGHPAWTVW